MGLLTAWPCVATAASADDLAERQAAARALFDEGLEHLKAERWTDAADRFDRASALRPSPEISYNLTTALVRMGRLVRASEILRQVGQDGQAPAKVRQAAETRLAQVLPRLSRLTVQLDEGATGLQVLLDGTPMSPATLGVAIPVDPGPHDVDARRNGRDVFHRRLVVGEGGSAMVTVSERPPVTPAPAEVPREVLAPVATAVPPAPAPADSGPRVWRRWWFWTLVGAAAVGAGAVAATQMGGPQAVPGNVDPIHVGR